MINKKEINQKAQELIEEKSGNTVSTFDESIRNEIVGLFTQEREMAEAGFNTEEMNLLKLFDCHSDDMLAKLVDENERYPLLRDKKGNGMFSIGDFCAIKSQVGQGKTQACCIVACAALGFGGDFGLEATQKDCYVLYADTELDGARTLLFRDRVWAMTNHSPNFHVANLNDLSSSDVELDEPKLRQMLKLVIHRHRMDNPDQPMMIIIDSLARFVEDPNELKENKKFIQDLAGWASKYRVNIAGVIHENEGYAGGKMTGHLGSYAMRQAREVYRTTLDTDTGIFTMSNKKGVHGTKYTDGPGVEDVSWRIQDGVFVPAETPKKQDKKSSGNMPWKDKWRPRFERVFGSSEVLTHSELIDLLATTEDEEGKTYCASKDSAKQQIKRATEENILCKVNYPNVKQGYKMVKDGEVG